jgi:hypothetical protein
VSLGIYNDPGPGHITHASVSRWKLLVPEQTEVLERMEQGGQSGQSERNTCDRCDITPPWDTVSKCMNWVFALYLRKESELKAAEAIWLRVLG